MHLFVVWQEANQERRFWQNVRFLGSYGLVDGALLVAP